MPRSGGPSTIWGVLYQVLGTLNESCVLSLSGARRRRDLAAATLIVEPKDGGDAQVHTDRSVRVVQWKSRSTDRPWSLSEIVSEVLPDLYRATHAQMIRERSYVFVTDGRRGAWSQAETFFRECRGQAPDRLPGSLDNTERVGRIDGKGVTRRSLFRRISADLRRSEVATDEPIGQTYRRLWHLLGNLSFEWEQSAQRARQQLDLMIYDLVLDQGKIQKARHDLQGVILELAAEGGTPIAPREILRRAGLDVGSFRNWPRLREQLRSALEGVLRRDLDYDRASDVREPPTWPQERPTIVVSGESGAGKTWRLAALSVAAAKENGLVVWFRARGDASADLDAAARIVCLSGLERVDALAMESLARARSHVAPEVATPWLTVFIDDVQSAAEARALVRAPLAEWGIRVAITAADTLGHTLYEEFPGQVLVAPAGEFSDDELQDYLERGGCQWGAVPADLRPTLRRPLLARLYRQMGSSPTWRPQREYQLYETFWERLRSAKEQHAHPQDQACLRVLARRLLQPSPTYPWGFEECHAVGADDAMLARCESVGWIRRRGDGGAEITHDRLLNWAVAEALVEDWQSGHVTTPALASLLRSLFGEELHAGKSLAYVPMDVLWRLAGMTTVSADELAPLVEAVEGPQGSRPDRVYEYLFPTLGPRIVRGLLARVRATDGVTHNPYPAFLAKAVRKVAEIDRPVADEVTSLADDASPGIQQACELLLARFPRPEPLDVLWQRQVSALQAIAAGPPDVTLWTFSERRERALAACLRLRPGWIADRIAGTEDSALLRTLAVLIQALDRDTGRPLWAAAKGRLFERLPADRADVLADCIAHFGDSDEVARLTSWLEEPHERLIASAFGALSTVSPLTAISQLPILSPSILSRTRNTWLSELLTREPEQTARALSERVRSASDDVWSAADAVYGGQGWLMDGPTADVLLTSLEALVMDARESSPEEARRRLRGPLHTLAKASAPDALSRFAARAASGLEGDLAALASSWVAGVHAPEIEDAKRVLLNIGPTGLAAVARAELGHHEGTVRLAGIGTAVSVNVPALGPLLNGIISRETVLPNGTVAHEVHSAVRALAALGDNVGVVQALLKWGPEVSGGVAEERRGQVPMSDVDLCPVFERISASGANQRAHAVLALGASGRTDLVRLVQAALRDSDPVSDVARAAILALEDLDAGDPETAELLERQLGQRTHEPAATRALLAMRSSAADAVLDAYLARASAPLREPELVTALNLAGRPGHERGAADALWRHMNCSTRIMEDPSSIEALASLDDPQVRPFIRARAFPSESPAFAETGIKFSAIRALARFDRGAAFTAAELGLKQGLHGNDDMPFLLLEIDPVRGLETVLDWLSKNPPPSVERAIALELRQCEGREDVHQGLSALLSGPASSARRTAAAVTGFLGPGFLAEELRRLAAEDPVATVRDACREALWQQAKEHRALALLAELASAVAERRWPLLEAFFEVADPRFIASPKDPLWLWRVLGPMPEALNRHARNRRKEMLRESERAIERADREHQDSPA